MLSSWFPHLKHRSLEWQSQETFQASRRHCLLGDLLKALQSDPENQSWSRCCGCIAWSRTWVLLRAPSRVRGCRKNAGCRSWFGFEGHYFHLGIPFAIPSDVKHWWNSRTFLRKKGCQTAPKELEALVLIQVASQALKAWGSSLQSKA